MLKCSTWDVDDGTVEPEPERFSPIVQKIVDTGLSLSMAVITSRETLAEVMSGMLVREVLKNPLSMLAYACEYQSRRKRVAVDVKAMIDTWVPLVTKLATAHDIDERDLASSQLDEALTPILAAPIAQVRDFYRGVTARLKDDPKVPWSVWRLFEFWGTNVLDKIKNEEQVVLKTEIAKRIAENSVAQIPTSDWVNAMIGALQWRTPEKLQQIESNLKRGVKPRVRGKESCLFLVAGEAEVML
jgi:hypothetical protein